jgi:polysaccharide biosynthesis/export protein PslD
MTLSLRQLNSHSLGLCLATVMVGLLSSCSTIFPHDRPIEPDFTEVVTPKSRDLIDPDQPFEGSRYLPRYSMQPGDSISISYDVREVESEDDYIIEKGDVIELTILFHTEVDGPYKVRPDGKISLPYKSDFRIAGMSPEIAGSAIAELYSDIFRNPSVSLQLKSSGERIDALRQVFNRGDNQGQATNIKLGPDGFLSLPIVGEFPTDGLTVAQLEAIVNSAYSRMAPEVTATITLVDTAGYGVFVMGEVLDVGRKVITGPITASRALAMAGGHDLTTADLENVILLSLDVSTGVATAHRVDLKAVIEKGDVTRDVLLGPNDVLIVPSTSITDIDRWVDQYVAKMLLFRGLNSNLTYRIN